ncbi:unnamed protein product [Ilex paraguariensis]|uniref:Uncharacterized protein n=1 Tax=Ilex paraguariensis TaxID=185542 RepID=A0ABC8RPD9_9AQUA
MALTICCGHKPLWLLLGERKKLKFIQDLPPKKDDNGYDEWVSDNALVITWLWKKVVHVVVVPLVGVTLVHLGPSVVESMVKAIQSFEIRPEVDVLTVVVIDILWTSAMISMVNNGRIGEIKLSLLR